MEFAKYLELGIGHILDINGLDHVLFLIVLVVMYDRKSWKKVLILATAFTLGHSITLAIAGMDIIKVNNRIIEIFIAASIAVTALANIISSKGEGNGSTRYIAALLFGLVHGLGFSGFFKTILGSDNIVLPLLGFNIGVEIAQAICVICVLIISAIITDLLKIKSANLVIRIYEIS